LGTVPSNWGGNFNSPPPTAPPPEDEDEEFADARSQGGNDDDNGPPPPPGGAGAMALASAYQQYRADNYDNTRQILRAIQTEDESYAALQNQLREMTREIAQIASNNASLSQSVSLLNAQVTNGDRESQSILRIFKASTDKLAALAQTPQFNQKARTYESELQNIAKAQKASEAVKTY
jgi:hypothetical protein